MKKTFLISCLILLTVGSCRLSTLFGSGQLVPDRLDSSVFATPTATGTDTRLSDGNARLRVMAYNVFLRPDPVGWGDENTCRARQIGKALSEQPLDIVVLNETFSAPDVASLANQTAGTYPYRLLQKPRGQGLKTSGGLTLLSRYPIDRYSTHAFHDCGGAFRDCLATKGFLHAVVDVSDDLNVNVVATHLDAGHRDRDRAARRSQLRQIRQYLSRRPIFDEWPTLLLGDLNVDGLNPDAGRDSEYNGMLATLGNTCASCDGPDCQSQCTPTPFDVYRRAHRGWDVAAHTTRHAHTTNCSVIGFDTCRSPNEDRYWHKRRRLDYILSFGAPSQRPNLETHVRQAAHPSFRDDTCGTTYLSDHRAVAAEILVGPGPMRTTSEDVQAGRR
jgi:endonuclease/exonuclease/phosphatase family metal-dependent hydrolase